jgi:pyruvate,water dikinase
MPAEPSDEAGSPSTPWVVDLRELHPGLRDRAGGKAVALAALHHAGLRIPGGLCVLTGAYDWFVDSTGLRQAIAIELGRKRFEDMRWEEIWDASLRIRNLFLRASADEETTRALEDALSPLFADRRPAVVRSSAPAEDTAATSFAGLHESYVNVRGIPDIVEAVRKVWSSLWTDRALLYRKELGLDVSSSSMAVVVQELVTGEISGIAFSRSPLDESQAVVEAVWGLNEGLVDGTIEPDRWILDLKTASLIEHRSPQRAQKVAPVENGDHAGTRLVPLPRAERDSPPLTEDLVREVMAAATTAERLFGHPQDVEWTIADARLWLLQSRPVSTLGSRAQESTEAEAIARDRAEAEVAEALGAGGPGERAPQDERPWYLNLRKSFGGLQELRHRVEEVAIPQMKAEADAMAGVDLFALSDEALAVELVRRQDALARWEQVYYQDFVPLAHGVRLFGQIYNDRVRPVDPYEFVDLLSGSGLLSVSRNTLLEGLARRRSAAAPDLDTALDDYLDRFGSGPGTPETVRSQERGRLLRLLDEMARSPGTAGAASKPTNLATRYLDRFSGDERRFQEDLLDLARASYRLRDDDNVHLDRIRGLAQAALTESRARGGGRSPLGPDDSPLGPGRSPLGPGGEVLAPTPIRALSDSGTGVGAVCPAVPLLKARQLVGQPAGPGLAVGKARVCLDMDDLYAFQNGEVLVCDSLDPSMTFAAPLAAAIVERRGGMLVHGAIIAREYGLPCVTGVPDATLDIRTGDILTVDGFLGIVVVGGTPPGSEPAPHQPPTSSADEG